MSFDLLILEDRLTPSTLTPDQVRHAYGIDAIPAFGGTIKADGAGQTIAIVDAYDDPNIAADVAFFNAYYGTTANQLNARPTSGQGSFLKVVNQTGGSTLPASDPTGGWEGEEALDVEYAHVIAPMADIILVECDSPATLEIGEAWALSSGAAIVSNSWGSDEYFGESSGDSTYTNPSLSGSPGVAILFSSGDSGVVSYPSASPNVLSVGATDLYVNSNNTYSSETAWSFDGSGGGGGGASSVETRPSYQNSVKSVVGTSRGTPDVSSVGGSDSPLSVYNTFMSGGFEDVWGTSASCPEWAGLVAIIDQGRAAAGLKPYNTSVESAGSLTSYQLQTNLYALAANATTYKADFHDVKVGQNAYGDQAKTGYDLVTGLGTPIANKLVPDMVGYSSTAIAVVSSSSTPYGAIKLSATVTGPLVTATGKVDFKSGSTDLGTATLSNGTAILDLSSSPIGAGTQPITAYYLGDYNYATSNASTTVTLQQSPTITTASTTRPTLTYGQSVILIAAVSGGTGTPTGTVNFKVGSTDLGTATLDSSGQATLTTTSLPVGTNETVTVTYAGNGGFLASGSTISETVTPATVTVSADPYSLVYGGTTFPALTYTVSGLVNGDTAATVLTGAPTTTGTAASGAGTYPITQGTLASVSPNYTLSYVGSAVTITPAKLTVTANSATSVYGAGVPALTYSVSGLLNGDAAAAVLTGAPATTETGASPVGTYAITQGTLSTSTPNYSVTFTGSTAAVTPAPLAVLANPAYMKLGSTVPALTYNVIGLVNGDSAATALTGALTTSASAASDARSYAITQGTLAANANYTLSYVGNTLTVTAAPVVTPAVSTVSPSAASAGDTVTITGTGLSGATSVMVGGSSAAILSNSDTQVVVAVPAGTAGTTVPVVVTTASGSSPATTTGTVTYPSAVTLSGLTGGQVGVSYSQSVTASGGTGPYTYALTAGSLPAGLTLDSAGTLSGTPTTAGTYAFVLTATDSSGTFGSSTYSLAIAAATAAGTASTVQPVIVGSSSGTVQILDATGALSGSLTPFPGFTGEVRTATGANGAVVAGTGPGVTTEVKVIDPTTQTATFEASPFEASFTGGVFVATGDFTRDGTPDVIVTPDEGGGPRVRIYDPVSGRVVADFFGIDDPNFRGGARAAAADVNGDGIPDLIVSAGFGGGPRVTVWDGASIVAGAPRQISNFFLFEPTLRNGVYVAAGDVNGDGFADVVVGAGPGGGPRVQVLSGQDIAQGSTTPTVMADFFAGDPSNRGGVRVAVKNLDGDSAADLITAPGEGGGSLVTAYAGKSLAGNPSVLFSYNDPDALNGAFVG